MVLLCALTITAFAYFTAAVSGFVSHVHAATYHLAVSDADGSAVADPYVCPAAQDNIHTFTLTASGSASGGYCTITVGDRQYTTARIPTGGEMTIHVEAEADTQIVFTASWGTPAAEGSDRLYEDGDLIALPKPLAGRTISFLGDSISTYTGWSDSLPITDETCRFRYGEAYYGPAGGDFHNTELLVTDTWWHQAAQALGAEILMVNSGNSTGLLHASYPANADWEQYLQEMLVYKSRPDYLGKDGRDPDIIALYIGSNDVARGTIAQFGSIDAIDFDTLIVPNGDGTYTYAEPVTVAEAYAIMLHKIQINYPEAEVYCFAVVPNSGGYLSTCNTRLARVHPFNEMVRGVAAYYGAHVVELMDAFALDPDGDGIAVQEDLDAFKACFNGDPHPNAQGFDVITDCFVETVLENSRYTN